MALNSFQGVVLPPLLPVDPVHIALLPPRVLSSPVSGVGLAQSELRAKQPRGTGTPVNEPLFEELDRSIGQTLHEAPVKAPV